MKVFVLRGLKDGYKNENVRTQYIGDVFININCIASSCQHYMVHFNLNMNTFEKKRRIGQRKLKFMVCLVSILLPTFSFILFHVPNNKDRQKMLSRFSRQKLRFWDPITYVNNNNNM